MDNLGPFGEEVIGSGWLLILAGARSTILDTALSSAHTEFCLCVRHWMNHCD